MTVMTVVQKSGFERSIDKIKKDIETMSVAELEDYAMAYVTAIQSQGRIQKIQEKIRKVRSKNFSQPALQNDIKRLDARRKPCTFAICFM